MIKLIFSIGALLSSLLVSGDLVAQSAEAIELIRGEQWAAAATKLEAETAANPFQAMPHYYLAVSMARANRCNAAIPEFELALELGANGGESGMRAAHMNLARCHSLLGNVNRAWDHFYAAWREWGQRDFEAAMTEEAFETLRSHPEFRKLAELALAREGSQNERRQADLEYFNRLVTETHPDPFNSTTESAWNRQLSEVRSRIGKMSDVELAGALMALAARVGDGHTVAYPPTSGESAWHLLPIWPMWMADGWFIVAAAEEHSDLVGARILGAGDHATDELVESARRLLAGDNSQTVKWHGGIVLQFAEFYQLAGAVESARRIPLTLRLPNGDERVVELEAGSLDRDPMARFAPPGWPTLFGEKPPRWVRYSSQSFAYEALPGDDAMYVALNAVADGEDETLAGFGERLRAALEESRPGRLILDLRLNNGGNGNLRWGFLRPLMGYAPLHEPGSIRVLIGPRSYSATIMLIGDLESKFGANLYGHPTGGRPVKYSTETGFALPNTGVAGSISTRLHIDGLSADDRRPFFPPNVYIWPRSGDLQKGLDPVLDAALAQDADKI